MKKCLSLLLVLSLLLPVFAAAEEDLQVEDVTEEVVLDENGNEVIIDEETGETFVLTEAEATAAEALEELEEDVDTSVDPNTLEINPNLPDNVINLLLVGVDTRSSDPTEIEGLGDTEIIVSVNRDTGSIKMTSILRDSAVTVPGNKNKLKINNAFKIGCNRKDAEGNRLGTSGGAALAMRTINHNFQMNLQYCVAINFNGLASIIDSLGGVDIPVTKAEANYINSYLRKHPPAYDNKAKGERIPLDWAAEKEAGTQEVVDGKLTLHMDGVQAVMYARIRSLKGENDFNRTDRQRYLLDLLLQMVVKDMDVNKLADLIDACMPYAYTNMNLMALFELCTTVLRSDLNAKMATGSLIEQMRIPLDKNFSYKTINGSSMLSYNMEKHAKAIHEFIYGTYYPAE